MSKEEILEALEDEEKREQMLRELEVDELEEKAVTIPWLCYMPIAG
jgi:hypothetical protein